MTKHEHEWEKMGNTEYSICKCGSLRHDKDGHIFRDEKEALRPKGTNLVDRFFFWLANPESYLDIAIGAILQIALILILAISVAQFVNWIFR